MYTILISNKAEQDIQRSIEYYEEQLPNLSQRFILEFRETCQIIQDHPLLFRMHDPIYRIGYMKVFKHTIVYEVNEDKKTIIIEAVVYHSRESRM